MSYDVLVPIWVLWMSAAIVASTLTGVLVHSIRQNRKYGTDMLKNYKEGLTDGEKVGHIRGLLQAGPSSPDRYDEGIREGNRLLNATDKAFAKGYETGYAAGKSYGEAQVRVFTGNETVVQNKFLRAHTSVVNHVVVMMGNREVFRTITSKNMERDKIEKLLKEVTIAAGGVASGGMNSVAGIASAAAAAALLQSDESGESEDVELDSTV